MSSEIGSSVLLRRSALTASQKLRQSRATPLKSVENQSQDKADKMGEPDKLQNGAVAESGISIKTEPFTNSYIVEEQLGR